MPSVLDCKWLQHSIRDHVLILKKAERSQLRRHAVTHSLTSHVARSRLFVGEVMPMLEGAVGTDVQGNLSRTTLGKEIIV